MKGIALFAIGIYRNCLSYMKLQQTCRFYPSCSEYAALAVKKFGFINGLWLLFKRIVRCHPLSAGGFDPLPSKE